MTRLLLIRHGESDANRNRTIAGHLDVGLQEQGLQQAELTAQYVREHYEVDAVYASDLQRAYKTGLAVAKCYSLPISTDRRLREIMTGSWSGMKIVDIMLRYADDYAAWIRDIGNSRCTDGESTKELGARVLAAVTEIAQSNEGKTVVIATHATPIRVLQCMLEERSFDQMKDIPWVSNCSITELIYDNGQWTFARVGYDGHLAGIQTNVPNNI